MANIVFIDNDDSGTEVGNEFEYFNNQKDAFTSGDKKGHNFYWAVDCGEGGKKAYGSCIDENEFLAIYNRIDSKEKNFYELLRTDEMRYEYYDIDFENQNSKYSINELIAVFNSMRINFAKNVLNIHIENIQWRFLNSSKKDKISLHLVNRARIWADQAETEYWYDLFDEYVKFHRPDIKGLFDKGVSSKNRVMRIVGSSKFGQVRPLLPYEDDRASRSCPINEFLIQVDMKDKYKYVNDFSKFLTQYLAEKEKYSKVEKTTIKEQEKLKDTNLINSEDSEIEVLINLITDSVEAKNHSLCDDEFKDKLGYENFRNLCFAIINAMRERGDNDKSILDYLRIDIFNFYRHAENHKAEVIFSTMFSQKDIKNCYTIKSLHYWARENPEYKNYFCSKKYHLCGVFDPYEDYFWGDFKDEMELGVFDSLEDARKCLIQNFNRVCVCLKEGKDVKYLKIENDVSNFKLKESPEIEFSVKYQGKNKKGGAEELSIKFKDLYNDCLANIRRYNSMKFLPCGELNKNYLDEKFFNKFTGFNARFNKDYKMSNIELVLNHIKLVWCNNDDVKYEWVLSWLSNIIQHPEEKIGVMLVLFSEKEGAGKGLIAEWLCEHIFGFNNSVKSSSMNQVFGRFDSILCDTIFCVIDEVVNTNSNKNDYNGEVVEKMKSLISDKGQTIERKGIDMEKTKNYTNFLMLTNNSNAVKIGDEDRRICVFSCSGEKVGDREYFNNLSASLKKEETINDFYSYLVLRDNGGFNPKDFPKTIEREEMKLETASRPAKYIHSIKTGEYKSIFKPLVKDNKMYAKSEDLYADFLNWGAIFGFKELQNRLAFQKEISKDKLLGKSETIRDTESKEKIRCYNISSLFVM